MESLLEFPTSRRVLHTAALPTTDSAALLNESCLACLCFVNVINLGVFRRVFSAHCVLCHQDCHVLPAPALQTQTHVLLAPLVMSIRRPLVSKRHPAVIWVDAIMLNAFGCPT
jgi:hypothetical protein